MWHLSVPIWELILRALLVYAFLLLILRLSGKRQVGQLAPFDFVMLMLLSNAVQNSVNAGDNSFIGGIISAATLVAVSAVLAFVTFRSKRVEAFIDGEPQVLIRKGQLFERALARAQLTRHELNAALRSAGCTCVDEVDLAMLENNGAISVIARKIPGEGT
jgi:uncharacterized membrane protein YcaP (DUF421 family)